MEKRLLRLMILGACIVGVSCDQKQNNSKEHHEFMQMTSEPSNLSKSKPFFRDDIFAPEELRGNQDEPEYTIIKKEEGQNDEDL